MFDVNVVDTTGAGDAFTAGFVYQLLQVRDPQSHERSSNYRKH